MRTLINFHMHTTGSDGRISPEERVKEAIAGGLRYICFTDHYNVPDGIMDNLDSPEHHPPAYIQEVRRLQKQYADKIDISFGVELDWLEHHQDWLKEEIKKQNYDYVLGSVHFLEKAGVYYDHNFGKQGKEEWIKTSQIFGGTINFVKEYYHQLRLMAESGIYDCIGHFDIIKIYNENSSLFSEDEDWYRKEVLSVLDSAKKAGIAIEINVRSFLHIVNAQCPSLWILKEAKKRNIPITIGNDAHRLGETTRDLDKAYDIAKQAGYKEIVRFKARKRISIPID
jgi:histidinol-phosphatase (PHP family)